MKKEGFNWPSMKISKLVRTFFVVGAVAFNLIWGIKSANASTGWYKVAFDGSEVSFVAVNPYDQAQVVVVADGIAKITLDGGLLWRPSYIPSKIISVAFDPVRPGEMYAGTQRGLYYSPDFGQSWHIFGTAQSQVLSVTSVAVSSDAIFTTESAGSGNGFEEVYRFSRLGATDQLILPSPYPEVLAVDESNNWLYAGTHDVLYRSTDSGRSWEIVADVGPGGIGSFTGDVIVKNGQIWLSSADGIFESSDSGASWHKYAGYPSVIEFYPSLASGVTGLTVNGPQAFFGITNPYGSKEVYEVSAESSTKLDFKDYPNSIASGGGYLWVAGRTGLWRRDGLVSNQASVKRPVVVVPGIMGSWSVAGEWKLDPIGHTYDNLMKTMEEEGYIKDVTLFSFPYNWRQDDNVSARQLADKIASIKKSCGCEKVDIIGHSQGGLVARAYVESNYYANDVENLVELGTPNAGSVEDYSIWEAGVSVDQDVKVRLGLKLFNIEALEYHFTNLGEYIRAFIPSVGQLLPNYSYINGRTYPDNYPQNTFLSILNSPANVDLLQTRTHFYIVGSDSEKTLTGLEIGNSGPGIDWANGSIVNKMYGLGDGTVPIDSLQYIAHANLLLNEDHGGLAKHPSQLWIQKLVGDQLPQPADSIDQIKRLMLVYVESPVKISINGPSGHVLNNEVNQVSGAFYTGSDAQVQFATIPNPVSGKYQIKLTGKESGNYTVGVAMFDNLSGDTSIEQIGETRIGQNDIFEYDDDSLTLKLINTDGSNPSGSTGNVVELLPSSMPSSGNLTAKSNAVLQNESADAEVEDSVIAPYPYLTVIKNMSEFSRVLAGKKTDLTFNEPVQKSKKYLGVIVVTLFGTICLLWLFRKKVRALQKFN